MLISSERDKKLQELNEICKKCVSDKAKNYENLDRKSCMYCPTGIAVHSLDSQAWDDIDWTSWQWEHLYRH